MMMSITDPIFANYLPNRGSWILVQGRETFYNDDDAMIEFEGEYQAKKYCEEVLGKSFGKTVKKEPKQGWLI